MDSRDCSLLAGLRWTPGWDELHADPMTLSAPESRTLRRAEGRRWQLHSSFWGSWGTQGREQVAENCPVLRGREVVAGPPEAPSLPASDPTLLSSHWTWPTKHNFKDKLLRISRWWPQSLKFQTWDPAGWRALCTCSGWWPMKQALPKGPSHQGSSSFKKCT